MSLALITPCHNNFSGLRFIYDQIKNYLSGDFVWYIKDTGICDDTRNFFEAKSFVVFLDGLDLGIYDAINIALSYVKEEYYLVLGSDDSFAESGLLYLSSINFSFQDDVHTFPVYLNDLNCIVNYKDIPLYFSNASIVPSHSGGFFVRTSLHKLFGYYSIEYNILGDAEFILKLYSSGVVFIKSDFPLCIFSDGGISSNPSLARAYEGFKYTAVKFGLMTRLFVFSFRMLQLFLFKITRLNLRRYYE